MLKLSKIILLLLIVLCVPETSFSQGVITRQKKETTVTPSKKKRASRSTTRQSNKLEIVSVDFKNEEANGTVIDGYGSTFYSGKMRHIRPKIYYKGVNKSETKRIYMKFKDPNGNLRQWSGHSPEGYTWFADITLQPGGGTFEMPNWGNGQTSTYGPGTHTFELWADGKCIYTTFFKVNP